MSNTKIHAEALIEIVQEQNDHNKKTKEIRKRRSDAEEQLLQAMFDEDIEELEMTNGMKLYLRSKLIMEKPKASRKRKS